MPQDGSRYGIVCGPSGRTHNHISRQSPEFQDFERRGRHSPFADLFITVDKVWPDGDPPSADIDRIFLRKPDSPFSTITIRETGEQ